jgi:hypothetical protein
MTCHSFESDNDSKSLHAQAAGTLTAMQIVQWVRAVVLVSRQIEPLFSDHFGKSNIAVARP